MKSLLNNKEQKALKKAARTGLPVRFWSFGSNYNGVVDDRLGWLTAYPDGEVWEHFPHHYDGNTHYMEFSRVV